MSELKNVFTSENAQNMDLAQWPKVSETVDHLKSRNFAIIEITHDDHQISVMMDASDNDEDRILISYDREKDDGREPEARPEKHNHQTIYTSNFVRLYNKKFAWAGVLYSRTIDQFNEDMNNGADVPKFRERKIEVDNNNSLDI